MTCHNKGDSDSTDHNALYIQYNVLTQDELNLIIGYIPSGGPELDKWLFPTEDMLWEFFEHYNGAWNECCEATFSNIVR
jgi:hypothetical protein